METDVDMRLMGNVRSVRLLCPLFHTQQGMRIQVPNSLGAQTLATVRPSLPNVVVGRHEQKHLLPKSPSRCPQLEPIGCHIFLRSSMHTQCEACERRSPCPHRRRRQAFRAWSFSPGLRVPRLHPGVHTELQPDGSAHMLGTPD